ncbi:MAG: hypothetical protein HKP61_02815 [Dactylosporangium sp.]|nr:DUF3466 family protein [Dactylosporangium sp.]NNJ59891.1 hypothetical protein [Dactylosporangium sp.]
MRLQHIPDRLARIPARPGTGARAVAVVGAAVLAAAVLAPQPAMATPLPEGDGSVGAVGAVTPLADAGTYTMVDLGKLGQRTYPQAINTWLEVAGHFFDPDEGWHAFFSSPWRTGGSLVRLPELPCPDCASLASHAMAINGWGTIAGTSSAPDGTHAVLWVGDTVRDLGKFGEDANVTGMNNRGQVVGYGLTPAGEWHAFVWSEATGMRDIAPDLGWARAYDINDRGQIVGQCGDEVTTAKACLWEPDGTLRIVAGRPDDNAIARAINNRGVVVGSYGDADRHDRAFAWSAGVLTPLTGADDHSAIATDVNDAGTIVGHWYLPSPVGPWVWRDGHLTELPASASGSRQGPPTPYAVNRIGVIAGTSGTEDDPWFHAVLWHPSGLPAG